VVLFALFVDRGKERRGKEKKGKGRKGKGREVGDCFVV
jgi:hypothetical protein